MMHIDRTNVLCYNETKSKTKTKVTVENKNSIPQTIFNKYSTAIRLAVLVILTIAVQIRPIPAFATNELTGQELTIVARTNAVRTEAGLPALTIDSRLMKSATAKANDMATNGYFSHANLDGYRMAYWINGAGYTYSLAGENLAKGFHSMDRLMNAWIASPSHYKNLVEPKFTNIGIGMAEGWYEGQETLFIVQHFGVEANAIVKDTVPMVSVVAPLIESVAGTSDIQTVINTSSTPIVQSTPKVIVPATVVKQPTTPPALIQIAQASPLGGETVPTDSPLQFWPIFALMILALIGYLDEYLPLWTTIHPPKA